FILLLPPFAVLLAAADAMDIKSLRLIGTRIAVTVTGPGRVVFPGFVIICLNVTDMSPFGRTFTPVTLTPSTVLVPKVPKRDELLNILARFVEPKFIPLLL